MNNSPELIRLDLNLPDESITVQGILLYGECPHELHFDHTVSISDFPYLSLSDAGSHLLALLYDISDSNPELYKLEPLVVQGQNYGIGVFSVAFKEPGMVYILAHCNDQFGLGGTFTGAKFGLFAYHYKDILGENIENYIAYIRVLKINKANFLKKTQEIFNELEEKNEEKKHYEEIAEYLSKRYSKLKDELETAKLAIQQLNYQIEKKRTQMNENREQNLECTVCRASLKNIVFLPCGHIILCKNCLNESMGLAPNAILNKRTSLVKCPKCSNPVKELKEVHF